MRGSKENNSIGRKEYLSISRVILGCLLRNLESLFESKSRFKHTFKPNTNIFHHDSSKTVRDKYDRTCILVMQSVRDDHLVTDLMISNLLLFFPASPQVRN